MDTSRLEWAEEAFPNLRWAPAPNYAKSGDDDSFYNCIGSDESRCRQS